MTRINLLPWREVRRQQQQRSFITMSIAAVALAAIGVSLTYLHIDKLIEHQEGRNQYLRGEIAFLKKAAEERKEMDKTKERLEARLEIIQNLQTSRPVMVRVLDSLVHRLPEDAFLSLLDSQGKQLTLKGIASSNIVISNFMRSLADSPWFGEPSLQVVETQQINEVRASAFELTVNQTQPKKTENEDEQL